MQNKNFLLAFALSLLLFAGWMQLRLTIWPQPELKKPPAVEIKPGEKDAPKIRLLAAKAAAGPWVDLKAPPAPPKPTVVRLPPPAPPTPADKLITLGDDDPASRFHLRVVLDPRGAGVRSVVLNKFQEADDEGRPVWRDKTKKEFLPLELVPDQANREWPSNVLLHFRGADDDRPMDTLGKAAWTVAGPVALDQTEDERKTQRIAFSTELAGLRLTKTFTLTEGDYHLGMAVTMSRPAADEGTRKFRYQLSGAHGLPIEGRWYTSIFRNALIARAEKGSVWRDLQDSRQISFWEGGKEILREPGKPIRYAGVAVQYFASVIVVDDEQTKQDFLRQARPTLETAVARGVIRKIDRDRGTFDLGAADQRDDRIFHIANEPEIREAFTQMKEGARIAVIYHRDGANRSVATKVGSEMATQPLWEEDITVRVGSETVELKPGEEVTHKYLLYNGPVKPSLLNGMTGAAAVSPELVQRYASKLSLNTMTDYQTPGGMGTFASTIYLTQIIILFTNLMHGVLGLIHAVISSYGICIILLTVLVRGAMFPLSRKQALMSMKMQELAPELKKMQAKFKDDRQAMGHAQMELYRKHNINPFGTCWLLLLQMPVFMGLYFALQESIQFRLASFWPTWIHNLAAPDMMFYWGEKIPMLSRPEDYGGLLYLGPYFNLLPVIAVVLMILQQKMMTPPPTDEQQQMQQAMMKYMMIFFGLMFYKVASGLCIYFIASSVWGFTERKLLPKLKPKAAESGDTLLQKMIGTSEGTDITTKAKRKPERIARQDDKSTMGRLKAWWADVLEQAKKKER